MNEISDFNKYKKAKQIVRELNTVVKILTLAYNGLKPFREYYSLQETMLCLQDSKMILEIHLEHHRKVLENKGKIE